MFFDQSVILRQIVIGGAALAAAWFVHRHAIVPLKVREVELVHRRAELQEQLGSARKTIGAAKDSDQTVAEARAALSHLVAGKAQVPAMVSFPGEIEQHFSRFGFPSAIVRLATVQPETDLPGFQRVYWSVGLPIPRTDRNVDGLLLAVAGLEQQERFIKVIDFALQPDAVDPSLRTASVSNVVLDQK